MDRNVAVEIVTVSRHDAAEHPLSMQLEAIGTLLCFDDANATEHVTQRRLSFAVGALCRAMATKVLP